MIRPEDYVPALILVAWQGRCAKDRRAAALVFEPCEGDEDVNPVLGVASNGPPFGFACTRDAACAATCGQSAVHAEMRALLQASPNTRGAEMIHLRIDADGTPQASRPPRCPACTKHMLDAGVAALWLLHADGWKRYPMAEAHAMSAAARGIHAQPASTSKFSFLVEFEGVQAGEFRPCDDATATTCATSEHRILGSGVFETQAADGSRRLVFKNPVLGDVSDD